MSKNKGKLVILEVEVKEARTVAVSTEEANDFVDECLQSPASGIGAFQITKEGIRLVKFSDELQNKIRDLM